VNETVTDILPNRPSWSAALPSRLTTLARTQRRQIELVLATILYLGFASYLTWPLVTDLSHSIYGAPGDPYGTLALLRVLVGHNYNPFLPGTISQWGAPAGIPIAWPRNLASAPEIGTLYLLTLLFGAIPAYGVYTLAGFTLTGVVTFLFVRRLTGNTWAALIAGWAFAFYPFADINGRGHPDNIQGWLLVLALWRMVELMWQPTRRNGLLAGFAIALCMWWSPYFILFGGVAYVVVTAVALLFAWRGGGLRPVVAPQLIAALVVCAFLAGLAVLATVGEEEGIGARTHSAGELFFYSARPLEYVIPDVKSPLFGSDTQPFLAKYPVEGDGIETTLYVGDTVILLALVAFLALVRRRLPPRLGGAVLALSLVAVAGVISSMSPEVHIFGTLVPFPSHFISQVTTTWRVYSRFVIVVMCALAVLAAVGLDVLTRGRSTRVKIGAMALATVIIPLDLWAPQPGNVDKITTPGIYKTLAREPPGLVSEYPLAPSSFNTYSDILFESTYDKPLTGGFADGSFEERLAYSLTELSKPSTAPRLATLGVRYVILDATPASWGGWPEPGTPGAGYRLIASEPYGRLYLVTAHPRSPALVTAGEGFGGPLTSRAGEVNRLEHPSGTLELLGACTSCKGVLSMTVASYAEPHTLTFLDEHGHVLGRGTVGSVARVTLPLRFSKHAAVRVAVTPEPQSLEGGFVSIEVARLEFSGARQAGASQLRITPEGGRPR
jgi:hypothetical protein